MIILLPPTVYINRLNFFYSLPPELKTATTILQKSPRRISVNRTVLPHWCRLLRPFTSPLSPSPPAPSCPRRPPLPPRTACSAAPSPENSLRPRRPTETNDKWSERGKGSLFPAKLPNWPLPFPKSGESPSACFLIRLPATSSARACPPRPCDDVVAVCRGRPELSSCRR